MATVAIAQTTANLKPLCCCPARRSVESVRDDGTVRAGQVARVKTALRARMREELDLSKSKSFA